MAAVRGRPGEGSAARALGLSRRGEQGPGREREMGWAAGKAGRVWASSRVWAPFLFLIFSISNSNKFEFK